MATLTRDDNRFPLDGTSVVTALATVHVRPGLPTRLCEESNYRRAIIIGNPHASLFLRLAMTSGSGLGEDTWALSVPPQGSAIIDGAYAQAAWWAYCYETVYVPVQAG